MKIYSGLGLTSVFPLLDLAVQETQAHASGARQGQRGQYGVDPDVVDDNLVVHEPAVHVDGPAVRAVALAVADHRGGHGRGRGGRGDRLCGGRRGGC